MFNKVVSDVFPDLFSNPLVLFAAIGLAGLAALALVFFGGMNLVKNATFGFEKRRYRKILEDEKTRAFLSEVAKAGNRDAAGIAQEILDKSSKIVWKKINEDHDLNAARGMCEDIDILREVKL